ncbi:MAG TPA: VCBS repeat-containing protein, partial [Thermoanaerobaculia bacterium]
MRRRVAFALSVALLLLGGCASPRKDNLPTLEDYSDGTSAWADALLAGWKAGAIPPQLLAPHLLWSGPLPGDGLAPVATARAPLVLSAYRAPAVPSAAAASADFGTRLAAVRASFSKLGRTDATLFGFERRGADREIVLGLFFSGHGTRGELRQEGGKLRVTLVPDPAGGWRLASGCVLSWLTASAAEPLFEERAAAAGLTRPHRAYLPNASRNIPVPGEHLPPGVAVLDFDGDGHPDLFVAGGDGNRLYRNRGDGTFEDATAAAGVGGQEGEAAGALSFDFDNDGHPDLYVTYLDRPNLLYRNRGDGTFEEVGARAGVALKDYSTSAAALDYDRDG